MRFFRKFAALFRRKQLDAEMAEEMRLHLERRTEEKIAAGMSVDKARYAAQRQFGRMEQIKEIARRERSWMWLENRGRDLRFSLRSLRRSPGLTATVVVTLALCVGANTAIFSALQSLVLKPLPYRDPGQLVEVYNSLPKAGMLKEPVSVAQYVDYKTNADLFEAFALRLVWPFNFGGESYPVRLGGAKVTADYFTLLGVQPLLGRFYTAEECVPGKDHGVVLTQTFWENYFGSDPAIIGKEIRLSGEPFTVIGVAPRRLEVINGDTTVLLPFEMTPAQADPKAREDWSADMFARLRAGVALKTGEAQLTTFEDRFFETASAGALSIRDMGGQRIALGRVRAEQTNSIRGGLLLLQSAAAMVLLLGVLNVTNLMLARANTRSAEFAIRSALGAGRLSLSLQLLTESLLLVGVAAVVGVILAYASARVLNTYKAAIVREAPPVAIDAVVLGVTLLLAVLAALTIALLPILRSWRTGSDRPSQGDSHGALDGRGSRQVSGALVTGQVAMAFMLLIGALLLIRSYARVQAVDPGFDAKVVWYARVALNTTYRGQASIREARDRILAAVREIPGVQSVSLISGDPVEGQFSPHAVVLHSYVAGSGSKVAPTTNLIEVSPDFFKTTGIRIIDGRGFTEADEKAVARTYIVDRNFAEKYFPGRSAVGERFETPGSRDQWPVIVGVAEVARFLPADDPAAGHPFAYTPFNYTSTAFSMIFRTQRSKTDLLPILREKLRGVDPALPIEAAQTFDTILDDFADKRRGMMTLLSAFALIALGLSAVGIFGMLAYDVTRRTREIAVRGALGGAPQQIMAMILRQGIARVVVGLTLGLGGALYLTRFVQSQLFEVQPWDFLSYLSVAIVLSATSLLACWLPARRATRIDPMVAMRAE